MRLDSSGAFTIVFATGLASCLGPCTASRLIASAALTAGEAPLSALRKAGVFVGGFAFVYSFFGIASSAVMRVLHVSTYIYAVLAVALAVSGVVLLARGGRPVGTCASHGVRSCGASFFAGAGSALLVSPCCTPVVLAVCAYASAGGSPIRAALLLACFAAGHCAPVLATSFGASHIRRILTRDASRAAELVSAGLMLSLSGLYALLA